MARADALRALRALIEGAEVGAADYAALRDEMRRYANGVVQGGATVGVDELWDAVDEVLSRIVPGSERARLLPTGDAALGYVMRMLRNLLVDRLRSRRELPNQALIDGREDEAVDDAGILHLLDGQATLESVQRGLEAAVASGDKMTFDVVVAWLDAADSLGAAPSARAVAEAMGISHVTVGSCLKRFREAIT